MDLGERLQDARDDLVFYDLFLALLLYGKVGNSCNHISKNVFLFLMVKQIEEYFQEAFPREVLQNLGVLSQIAHQLDHEPGQLVPLLLVNGVLEAVFDG